MVGPGTLLLPLLGGLGGVRGTMFLTQGVMNGRSSSGVTGAGRGVIGGGPGGVNGAFKGGKSGVTNPPP